MDPPGVYGCRPVHRAPYKGREGWAGPAGPCMAVEGGLEPLRETMNNRVCPKVSYSAVGRPIHGTQYLGREVWMGPAGPYICNTVLYIYYNPIHVLHSYTCTTLLYMYYTPSPIHVLHSYTCTTLLYMFYTSIHVLHSYSCTTLLYMLHSYTCTTLLYMHYTPIHVLHSYTCTTILYMHYTHTHCLNTRVRFNIYSKKITSCSSNIWTPVSVPGCTPSRWCADVLQPVLELAGAC